MNTLWGRIFLLFSFAAELGLILLVPLLARDEQSHLFVQALWWLARGGFCLMFVYGLKNILPAVFTQLDLLQFSGMFAITFFIPLVGMLGILAGCVTAFYRPVERMQVLVVESSEPDLPFKAEIEGASIKPLTTGCIRETLNFSLSIEERVNAVLSIRYIDTAQAVTILRLALKDKVDDVRLLAYSVLDQKESHLRDEIRELQQTMGSSQWNQQAVFLKQLASKYWQLVDLGLLQGGLEVAAAEEAVKYARQVLDKQPDMSMYRIMVRYYRYKNETGKTRQTLEKMMVHGLPEKYLYQEFVELAIAERDFAQLWHYLSEMKGARRFPLEYRSLINISTPSAKGVLAHG